MSSSKPAELYLEIPYRLRSGDFDRSLHLSSHAILDLFQDVAGIQAREMGIGYDQMAEHQVFWAVIRTAFEIDAAPQEHEEVLVSTWPHSPSKYSFHRDYCIQSKDGTSYVRGTSEWILMDVVSRKMALISDYYHEDLSFSEERALGEKLRKIKTAGLDYTLATTLNARYSDCDKNGHVNNARYASFALDALYEHYSQHKAQAPSSDTTTHASILDNTSQNALLLPEEVPSFRFFQIDFRHEVAPGESLTLLYAQANSSNIILGKGPDDTVRFACCLHA